MLLNASRCTGKERDAESGLDYFGARYYASNMGRWVSPDWASNPQAIPYASYADPQSLNLYNYMRNNPLGGVDADGHLPDWLKDLGIGFAKGFGKALSPLGNGLNYLHNLTHPNGQQLSTDMGYSYDNLTQAQGGAVATGVIMAAGEIASMPGYGGSITVTAEASAPVEEGISDAALQGRANAIQAAQDSFGQTKSTTAEASVTDANGNTSVMVGSSRNALTPSQRAALLPGEAAVTGPGHAETTVINAAQSQGMTVNSVAASRPVCATCSQAIQDAGARQVTPNKPPQ
jgi:RHS repeat-associated protein